jgi:hypothetical protein
MADRLKPQYDTNQMGEVYAIKCESFVKIGWSMTVKRRLNQISANNPHDIELLGTAPGTISDEGFIQMLLERPYRQKGEWFKYEGLVIEVVENLIHSGDAKYTAQWLAKRLEDKRAPRPNPKSHGKRPRASTGIELTEADLDQISDALSDWGHGDG